MSSCMDFRLQSTLSCRPKRLAALEESALRILQQTDSRVLKARSIMLLEQFCSTSCACLPFTWLFSPPIISITIPQKSIINAEAAKTPLTPPPPHPHPHPHPPRGETRRRTLPLKLYFSIILFLASILKWLRCGNKYNNYCCPQMSHYWESQNWQSHPSQNSRTRNSQKVIQDQNYSNEIFYSLLSTLESIVRYYQGNHSSQFHNKMFKSYDRVDYGSKNIQELKSQLQTHMFIFQASKMAFDQENPNQWQLPSNFDIQKSKEFLHNALNFLSQRDQQSFNMAKDIQRIIDGHLGKLNFQNYNFDLGYSEAQKKDFSKQLFRHGIIAGEEMDRVGEEVKHVTDASELTSKVNQANDPFHNSNNSNVPSQNTKDIKQHEIPMEIQSTENQNSTKNQQNIMKEIFILSAIGVPTAKLFQKGQILSNEKLLQLKQNNPEARVFQRIQQLLQLLQQLQQNKEPHKIVTISLLKNIIQKVQKKEYRF